VGFTSYSQFQGLRKKKFYQSFLEGALDVDEEARKMDSEFNRLWAEVENAPPGGKFRKSPSWLPMMEAAGLSPDDELWRQYPRLNKVTA
jgi:hypothetical protein